MSAEAMKWDHFMDISDYAVLEGNEHRKGLHYGARFIAENGSITALDVSLAGPGAQLEIGNSLYVAGGYLHEYDRTPVSLAEFKHLVELVFHNVLHFCGLFLGSAGAFLG